MRLSKINLVFNSYLYMDLNGEFFNMFLISTDEE
jgi:hypothetical protein